MAKQITFSVQAADEELINLWPSKADSSCTDLFIELFHRGYFTLMVK